MSKTDAYLFFWKANFMYIGLGIQTKIHDHHAVQVIIDLDSEFELRSANDTANIYKAVIINSDIQHECITSNHRMVILNIEPESLIGKGIKQQHLINSGFKNIETKRTFYFIQEIRSLLDEEINEQQIVSATEKYLYDLVGKDFSHFEDERINKVVHFLAQQHLEPIKIKQLAAMVHMSESRLIHLFTKQVGLPIRKYILWNRLVLAIQRTFHEGNITRAALDANFSDAAHFNKTLKRMFGLNLTNLKSGQLLKAYWV